MPSITLHGITASARFKGSVSAASLLQPFDISTFGAPVVDATPATISITVDRSTDQVAPEAVFLKTTVSGFPIAGPAPDEEYDPTFHKIFYLWTCDGAARSADVPPNLHAAQRDKNVKYTPHIADVMEAAGSRTWTVNALYFDSINGFYTASDSVEITTQDPDVVYTGTRTICVSPTGDFSGAPAGHDPYTDMETAFEAYRGRSETGRMLIQHDVGTLDLDFVLNDGYMLVDNGFGAPNFYLGTFGGPGRPRLTTPMGKNSFVRIGNSYAGERVVITGVEMQGGWDAATETPQVGVLPPAGIQANWAGPVLAHDCIGHGCLHFLGTGGIGQSNLTPSYVVVNDCDVTDWQNYGLYFDSHGGGHIAVMGTSIRQNPDAHMGGGGKDSSAPFNWHGPCRVEKVPFFLWDQVDTFTRGGWTTIGGTPSNQACLRIHNTIPGMRSMVSRCTFEGGTTTLVLSRVNGSSSSEPVNVLVEMCTLIAESGTKNLMSMNHGGCTARNNLFFTGQHATYNGPFGNSINVQYFTSGGVIPGALEGAQEIYSNTFVVLHSDTELSNDGSSLFINGLDRYPNGVAENNLFYAPNNSIDLQNSGTFDTTPMWPLSFKGTKWNGNRLSGSGQTPGTTISIPFTFVDGPGGRTRSDGVNSNGDWGFQIGWNEVFDQADIDAVSGVLEVGQQVLDTSLATTASSVALYRPVAPNTAISAADPARYNPRDLLGTPRPAAAYTLGAVEA